MPAWVWLVKHFGAEGGRTGVRGKSKNGEWTGEVAGTAVHPDQPSCQSFQFWRKCFFILRLQAGGLA